jgi:hypothetical protein
MPVRLNRVTPKAQVSSHDREDLPLPVPAAWQEPVLRAVDDWLSRTGRPRYSVAVALVEPLERARPAEGSNPDCSSEVTSESGLEVWLESGARTYKYFVPLPHGEPQALYTDSTAGE